VWEENLLNDLVRSLPLLAFLEEDRWDWVLDDGGSFSVRSTYLLMGSIFSPEPLLANHEFRVLNNIWKSPAPSKVIAFSWKLLRDRIPTRVSLAYRGVHVEGGSNACVHCHGNVVFILKIIIFRKLEPKKITG
jgi:hypothetical protein